MHLHLEQKSKQLRVSRSRPRNPFHRFFSLQERINVSLSINDKVDDNIRQIKRKLALYQSDLNRLQTEVPNTVSDKRIRAELAVVGSCEFWMCGSTFVSRRYWMI